MRFAFALALVPSIVVALRRQQGGAVVDIEEDRIDDSISADIDVQASSDANIGIGAVLRDRYLLEEPVKKPFKPGKQFPKELENEFKKAKSWSHDSFTDTWKARDIKTKEKLLVKLFYDSEGTEHLSWKSANAEQAHMFQRTADECTFTQKVMKHSDMYVGSTRICQCYHEHITDAVGTDRPVFVVMERCGEDLATVLKERARKGRTNLHKARAWLKQAVEALAFLGRFDPPLIHHDLKPENFFIDKWELKLGGLGSSIQASKGQEKGSAEFSPAYAAPEVRKGKIKFAQPVHSYDVYSLGLLYMQMMCAKVNVTAWVDPKTKEHRTLDAKDVENMILPCGADIGYIFSFYDDMELVARMLSPKPVDRPTPMDMLTISPLTRANWSAPDASPVFVTGDAVVHYSPGDSKRVEGTIADVRVVDAKKKVKQYIYDVSAPDGLIKGVDADYLMKQGGSKLE